MKCKICYNQKNNTSYKVKEMMFGFNEVFEYFQCSKCGCLQISEIPKDIFKYYPSDYYSFKNLKTSILSLDNLERILTTKRDKYVYTKKGIIGYLVNKIRPSYYIDIIVKANIDYDAKILDVGCGNGYFLRTLNDIGFKNLYGIDKYISQNINYSKNLKIEKKYLYEIEDKYDLIIFNHSFEHMDNPHDTLNIVSKLLSDDGQLIIRIPTVSSFAWNKYKTNWVQIDAPRHFFLHSIESIKLLCRKFGFDLVNSYYDSTEFQFWGSNQYKEGKTLNDSKPYNVKEFKHIAKKLNKSNYGDQVCLYFKKQGI